MMAKQKIPTTAHVPEESNFHAIPSLTAQQNAILRNHLGRAGTQSKIHKSRNTLQQLSRRWRPQGQEIIRIHSQMGLYNYTMICRSSTHILLYSPTNSTSPGQFYTGKLIFLYLRLCGVKSAVSKVR